MERLVGDVVVRAELEKEEYLFLIFAIDLRFFNRFREHTPGRQPCNSVGLCSSRRLSTVHYTYYANHLSIRLT